MAQIPSDKGGSLTDKTLVIIAIDSVETLSPRWRTMMQIVAAKAGNEGAVGYAHEGKAQRGGVMVEQDLFAFEIRL